jgi:hypothetical protein
MLSNIAKHHFNAQISNQERYSNSNLLFYTYCIECVSQKQIEHFICFFNVLMVVIFQAFYLIYLRSLFSVIFFSSTFDTYKLFLVFLLLFLLANTY